MKKTKAVYKKLKKVKIKLAERRLRKIYSILFVIAFAVIGVILLFSSRAASCTVSAKLVPSCGALWGYYHSGNAAMSTYDNMFGRKFDMFRRYYSLSQTSSSGKWSFPSAADTSTMDGGDIMHASISNRLYGTSYPTNVYDPVTGKSEPVPAPNWSITSGIASDFYGTYYCFDESNMVCQDQINNGKLDPMIDAWAMHFKNDVHHPVLMSFGVEVPDSIIKNITPAGSANRTALNKGYKNAQIRIIQRFKDLGVTNVVWSYVVGGFESDNTVYSETYPGDAYIDWIMWDPYNHVPTNWKTPYQTFSTFYNRLENGLLGSGAKLKAYGLGEYGSEEKSSDGTKTRGQWMLDIPNALKQLPKIKAIEYYDAGTWARFTDTDTNTQAESIASFKTAGQDPYVNPRTAPPTPPADTTAPTAAITNPSNGTAVSGTASVAANASDNIGVSQTNLYVDGSMKATDTTSPYSFSLNSTTLNNGNHNLQVKATDGAGNVGNSAVVAVNVTNTVADTTAPTAPANLTATQQSLARFEATLKWTASTDSVGVDHYRVTRDGGYNIGTSTTTSYLDKTLQNEGYHTYIVYAVDAAGNESPASNKAGAQMQKPDTTVPSTPTNLSATAASATQVKLSWTASTDNVGVTGYYVQRGGVTVAQVTSTSYTDNSVSASTSYNYNVLAYDASGNASPASATATVKTPAPPDTAAPTTPTNFAARVISSTQVNLSWTASTDNTGVTGYYIYRNNVRLTNTTVTNFGDATVAAGTSYNYTVKAHDAADNLSGASTVASVTTPPAQSPITNGLAGSYFSNPTLSGIATNRNDNVVNFDWASGAPLNGVPADGFSVRWTGRIYIPTSGTYAFYTKADDGVRLWVGDQQLIDDWTNHSAQENSATVNLTAGHWYNIKLEYYENKGLSVAQLLWSGPGISKNIIPSSALATSSYGLSGSYYDAGLNNILNRTDNSLNFDWGSGSPDSQVPTDGFGVRWTGQVIAPTTGTYTFYSQSDDGIRLWVGSQQLINNWSDHGVKEDAGSISLTGGTAYTIKVEYYENKGLSVLRLLWSGPGISKTVVPAAALLDR